jgi:hypothetical protein
MMLMYVPTKINNTDVLYLALIDQQIDLWLAFCITMGYVTVLPPIGVSIICLPGKHESVRTDYVFPLLNVSLFLQRKTTSHERGTP